MKLLVFLSLLAFIALPFLVIVARALLALLITASAEARDYGMTIVSEAIEPIGVESESLVKKLHEY